MAILLVVASAVVTYFIAKYGVAIDSSMIRNAVHTDATEVGQLLSPRMIPWLLLLGAAPILLIWRTDIHFATSGRYLLGSLKLAGLALGIAWSRWPRATIPSFAPAMCEQVHRVLAGAHQRDLGSVNAATKP